MNAGCQATGRSRHVAIDAVRGAVMIVMALDHVRDFVHADAMVYQPDDLARTTPFLFLTRWVTHFCAPAFVLLAGIAAQRKLRRDGSTSGVSSYLATRGLWLILVELTLLRVALNFRFTLHDPWLWLVLCALGVSMVLLAALVYLPAGMVGALGVGVILLHNLLDPIRAVSFGAFAPLWLILHQQGAFTVAGSVVLVAYPVLPWAGLLAAGFGAGTLYDLEPRRRQRTLTRMAVGMIAGFILLRLINQYGDPQPWSMQSDLVMTLLSFLRVTKYPPSLAFLLMTVGPILLALAWLERRALPPNHPLAVIGRVPLFYHVGHFFLAHVIVSAMAWLRHGGNGWTFFSGPFPSMGGARDAFPPDFGWPLWVVYVVWIAVVLVMYPVCRSYARVKGERRWWWLAYG
jgi:uncharacterized membrane protein